MACVRPSVKAFTLIEIAVVLVFCGLFAGLYLSLRGSHDETTCRQETQQDLEKIKQALTHFQETNERLPLPALRQAGTDATNFGREADSATLDHYHSGFIDLSFGALPFAALGLAPSYAGDCWHNKLTYVVTTALTDKNKFRSVPPGRYYEGQVEIADSTNPGVASRASQMAYAVISHGENGAGAVAVNYSGNESGFLKTATKALESDNYDTGNTRVIEAPLTTGSKTPDLVFDDIVAYSGRQRSSIDGKCRFSHRVEDRGQCAQGIADTLVADCSVTPHRDTWNCIGLFGGTTDSDCYSLRKAPCEEDAKRR